MKTLKTIVFISLIAAVSLSCKKEKFEYSADAKPTATVSGSGTITLVLEAGMGNWSLFYNKLVPLLNSSYQVVTINRAGYTNTTVPENSRDATTMAHELHDLLETLPVGDSVVLVGHSFGGLVVRMYQHLYPAKIKGVVLLDAAHPDQFTRLPSQFSEVKESQKKSMKKLIKTAQRGWLKSKSGKKRIPTFNLPEELLEGYYSVTTEPQYYAAYSNELAAFDESLSQVKGLPSMGALPLLVLASENSMDESTLPGVKRYPFHEHNPTWLLMQQELAGLSSNSLFASTAASNHYLAVFQPDWVAQQMIGFVETQVR